MGCICNFKISKNQEETEIDFNSQAQCKSQTLDDANRYESQSNLFLV